MATLRITVRAGKFIKASGTDFKKINERQVIGNGWRAYIHSDGTIECISAQQYSDGQHSIRYVLYPDNIEKLTLLTPSDGLNVLYKRKRDTREGVLGLSDGFIDERYAYFRQIEFQKFLDRYSITAVDRSDPNRIFNMSNKQWKDGSVYYHLYTDGVVEVVDMSFIQTQNECYDNIRYETMLRIKVSNATWAILRKKCNFSGDVKQSAILYSEQRVMTLNLPAFSESFKMNFYTEYRENCNV